MKRVLLISLMSVVTTTAVFSQRLGVFFDKDVSSHKNINKTLGGGVFVALDDFVDVMEFNLQFTAAGFKSDSYERINGLDQKASMFTMKGAFNALYVLKAFDFIHFKFGPEVSYNNVRESSTWRNMDTIPGSRPEISNTHRWHFIGLGAVVGVQFPDLFSIVSIDISITPMYMLPIKVNPEYPASGLEKGVFKMNIQAGFSFRLGGGGKKKEKQSE